MRYQQHIWYSIKQIFLYFVAIISTIFILHILLSLFFNTDYKFISSLTFLKNILIFNYGKINIGHEVKVSGLYFSYFWFSIIIVLVSFIFSFFISFAIAYQLAQNPKQIISSTFNVLIFVFSSVPIFILGPIAIVVARNSNSPIMYIDYFYQNIANTIWSLILPIFVLVITITPLLVSINYQIFYRILNQEYYAFAVGNGYNKSKIFRTVILRNWVSQFLENTVLIYVYLLSYTMIMERFFYIPGQSFVFQYFNKEKYFDLMIYAILINIIFISIIKAISDYSIYLLSTKKQETFFLNWKLLWKK